jgi:hypothetical protein
LTHITILRKITASIHYQQALNYDSPVRLYVSEVGALATSDRA